MALNHTHLVSLLKYNKVDGTLTWRRDWYRGRKGKRAGTVHHSGYRHLTLMGKKYQEHRLIWFYIHKEWPTGLIDHINTVKDDNRIENLRDTTYRVNNRNVKRVKDGSMSGVRGVVWCNKRLRWRVTITANGKQHDIGAYTDINDAINARAEAEDLHWGSER